MRESQHIAALAGMLSLMHHGDLQPRGYHPFTRHSPEQDEQARLDRKKKKQQRQNKKRNRK